MERKTAETVKNTAPQIVIGIALLIVAGLVAWWFWTNPLSANRSAPLPGEVKEVCNGTNCRTIVEPAGEQAIKDALIDDELDGIGLPPNTAVGGTEHERRREERKREALKYKYITQEDLFRFAAECADFRRHPETSVLDVEVETRDNSPARITGMKCIPIRLLQEK